MFVYNSVGIASDNASNESYAREQSATVVMHGNTDEMITNIEETAKGRVVLIFELNDKSFEVLFLENGGLVRDERASGTALEDMNGNTLTITGKEPSKAPKISNGIVQSLLMPVS